MPASTPRDAAGCRGAGTLLPVPVRASVGESLAPEPASPGGCIPPPLGREYRGPPGKLCTSSVRLGSGGWHSAGLLVITLSCTRGEQGVPRHLHLRPQAFWWPLSVQQRLRLCLQGAANSGNPPSILPTACLPGKPPHRPRQGLVLSLFKADEHRGSQQWGWGSAGAILDDQKADISAVLSQHMGIPPFRSWDTTQPRWPPQILSRSPPVLPQCHGYRAQDRLSGLQPPPLHTWDVHGHKLRVTGHLGLGYRQRIRGSSSSTHF